MSKTSAPCQFGKSGGPQGGKGHDKSPGWPSKIPGHPSGPGRDNNPPSMSS